MAVLVTAIPRRMPSIRPHADTLRKRLALKLYQDVDGRDKPGHDLDAPPRASQGWLADCRMTAAERENWNSCPGIGPVDPPESTQSCRSRRTPKRSTLAVSGISGDQTVRSRTVSEVGLMFWFSLKKLVGSYLFFRASRRG